MTDSSAISVTSKTLATAQSRTAKVVGAEPARLTLCPPVKGDGANALLAPCVFQVPLIDKDGREVAPEVIGEIRADLDRHFGGCTDLGGCIGYWLGSSKSPKSHIAFQ